MGFKVASRVRGLSDEAFREAFGTKEQCRAALVRLISIVRPRSSASSDDVCRLPVITKTGRRSAVRTWHQRLPRVGEVLVEPLRSAICCGDPEAPSSSSLLFELALAS